MQRIFKYKLELKGIQHLTVPKGARILSVQDQRKTLCVWALVDEKERGTDRYRILIFGTGEPIWKPELSDFDYLTTVLQADKTLVWHLFIKKETQKKRLDNA